MRRPARILGYALVALSAAYFAAYAARHLGQLPPLALDARGVAWAAVAVALSLATNLVAAVSFFVLLRSSGERAAPFRAVAAVSLVSQLAKYLPGNVGHFIGRVALGKRCGLDPLRVTLTLAYEILAMVAATALVALATLATAGEALRGAFPRLPYPWLLAVALLTLLALPATTRWLLSRRLGGIDLAAREIRRPAPLAVAAVLALGCLTFLIHGATLAALLAGLGRGEGGSLWLLAGLFAVAWLPGFLTPGAPGGLGVREAAMVTALGAFFDAGTALGLALASRAVSVVGEILAVAVGGLLLRLSAPPRGAAPPLAGAPPPRD